MRIPSYKSRLDEQMTEFDTWVTPSLGEIKDSPEFKQILSELEKGFDFLCLYTENFKNIAQCSGVHIASLAIQDSSLADFPSRLSSIIQVLLLSTGKSDNNLKCQFPIYLRQTLNGDLMPTENKAGDVVMLPIPRVLQAEHIISRIVGFRYHPQYGERLLALYLDFILGDTDYRGQLFFLGASYHTMKESGSGTRLLATLAIFQSRGALTAKSGHIPENILRGCMKEWGMIENMDFNTDDVDIDDFFGTKKPKGAKVWKYDFVLPYKSRKEGKRLFIQSQFYAGDSGSVSHKVVDQTDSSRDYTLKKCHEARFVEFLDGAGYCSSLNGDLRKMLAKKTTNSFFQIRTAPIKLRRELQEIGFLTGLEVEHFMLKGLYRSEDIIQKLLADGYTQTEIDEYFALHSPAVSPTGELLFPVERQAISLRYALLDLIAIHGHKIDQKRERGVYCIPGMRQYWGLNQPDLILAFEQTFPALNVRSSEMASHIQWLIDKNYIIILS